MNKIILQLVLTAIAALPVVTLAQKKQSIKREAIEWADIWVPNVTDSALPRVLLIGNSITRAYYKQVNDLLLGKAYVARLSTSQILDDPIQLSLMTTMLSNFKFDIIHFNNGMHGWEYSEDEYKRGFVKYLAIIKKYAPKAKLIWATTTPIKEDPAPGTINVPDNSRIVKRNEIAAELIKNKNIAVDDLHSLMLNKKDLYSDNVHFNGKGTELQAKQVSSVILEVLRSL